MIRTLALLSTLAAVLLFPTGSVAHSSVPVPVPVPLPPIATCGVAPAGASLGCIVGSAAATTEETLTARFRIRALTHGDGLGILIRDGWLQIEDEILSASIGCNTFSVPVAIDAAGAIRFLAQPVSTAKFCPELDGQEALLSAILLGRGLTLDLVGDRIASENGLIGLVPAPLVDPGTGIEITPAPTPLPSPIAGGGQMGGHMGEQMHEGISHHCAAHGACGDRFLASFATAAIALFLFGLGFLLGLAADRRGGLRGSPTPPTTPAATPTVSAPALKPAKKRTAATPASKSTTEATAPTTRPRKKRPANTSAASAPKENYRV